MSSPTELSTNVVVVGAGFAGLAAATRLHEAGLDTVVLEARDRVGGRAWSTRLDDGTVLDLGCQWIGASHQRLLHLAKTHGASTYPQHAEGTNLIRIRGRSVRFDGKVPVGLGPLALAALAPAILRLDRMARSVSVAEPWSSRNAAAWDGQTLETWIRAHVRTSTARSVLGQVLTGIFAADPSEVSLLHALTYIRAGDGLDHLTGTAGAVQDACFTDGMEGLADAVAAGLSGRVRLGQPVRRIRRTLSGVEVGTDDLVLRADAVVVAVPPTLAGRIDYDPPLPAARDQLTQRVPQGCSIKCFAVYETPFWRADGLSGLVLDCDGPVSMIIDASPDAAGPGILVGFYEGSHARDASGLSSADRREQVLACFSLHVGERALTPREYRDQDWSQEPFTRGCYAGVMPPGAWTGYGHALREPVGPIHWAGTETALSAMGYVEGALESGERAAAEVLAATTERRSR